MDEIQIGPRCINLERRKRAFLNVMEEEFASIIKSGKEDKELEWIHIKEFFDKKQNELKSIFSIRIYCDFAFKVLLTFDCEDIEFIMKLIGVYDHVMSVYSELNLCDECNEMFAETFPPHHVKEDIMHLNMHSSLNDIYINKLLEIELSSRFANRVIYELLALDAIKAGDYTFQQFLVRYGLIFSCSTSTRVLKSLVNCSIDTIASLLNNYIRLKTAAHIDLPEEEKQSLKEVNTKPFAAMILEQMHTSREDPNLRRIHLIVSALNISLVKRIGDSRYADYVKCFNLYASTQSDVPISMKDVKDVLEFVFSGLDFINETISRFRDTFPDTPDLPSPRSLKFLCRCQVRDSIQKCPSLTGVLSKMNIPVTVKDYLLYMSD